MSLDDFSFRRHHARTIHKNKIVCPNCGEKDNIEITSYVPSVWDTEVYTDLQITELSFECGACNQEFEYDDLMKKEDDA